MNGSTGALSAISAVIWIAVGLVGVVGVAAAGLWVTDYGLEATIVGKECTPIGPGGILGGSSSGETSKVSVRTKVFGIDHTIEDFPDRQCQALNEGNFVRYHIRSQRAILWASEGGNCIWDTEKGPC